MIEDLRAFIEKASKDLDAGCLTNEQIHSMVLELCEMSRLDERALESHLVRLYQHMLKYEYQKDHQSGSWICTIREQSDQISRFVKDKTLVHHVFSDLSSIYITGQSVMLRLRQTYHYKHFQLLYWISGVPLKKFRTLTLLKIF